MSEHLDPRNVRLALETGGAEEDWSQLPVCTTSGWSTLVTSDEPPLKWRRYGISLPGTAIATVVIRTSRERE